MKRQTDVLVVGGGVIGVCSAYYLAEKGIPVTVVDQGQICSGCSYGNAGLIVPSHSIPLAAPGVVAKGLRWMFDPESPFYIKPRLNQALISWLWRFRAACRTRSMLKAIPLLRDLSRASLALYEELASPQGFDFKFKRNGLLHLFRSRRGFEEGVEEAVLLGEYGISSKALEQRDLGQIEPQAQAKVIGGILFPDDAHLNPSEFVSRLASRGEKKGACFLTGTEVIGFETSGKRIFTVKTSRGDFEPGVVVLAAGSWSPQVASALRLRLPIQPAKGYSITVKCDDKDSSIPLILSEARVAVTPMGGVLRFAGTLELAGFDHSINQRRVGAIQRAICEYLSGTERYELVEIWRGLRPCTPDGLPIIGWSTRYENLIIATGHGTLGISLGPITGKLVAQLISEENPTVDPRGLGEGRFS